ncbi:hypothetical protein [Chryseobacterium sp. YIM B08800]|uniref:hypothetical protein n=1 Tax=Chryseobacterium sp. YIM B08800 TaxID=2984136 RepID=UPI002240B729|nr:hypothetical protein [Chryseobacterium sp. YIM B08800]
MKRILSILTLSLLTVFNSCQEDEAVYYEGDSLVHFNTTTQRVFVKLGTNAADVLVTYGVTKAAGSNSNVELVFNATKSTAVLGTDFTIVEGTDTLPAGNVLGDFKLNVKEAAALAGKKAFFTLKSSSLGLATFNTEVEVDFALACPLENFPLKYNVDVFAFGEYAPSHEQTLVPVPGTDNSFKVNSSWGPSFVAWATDNNGYNNQYLYPGTITIQCSNVTFTSDAPTTGPGGTGTYNPTTKVIEFTISQSLFTSPFNTTCTFTPL